MFCNKKVKSSYIWYAACQTFISTDTKSSNRVLYDRHVITSSLCLPINNIILKYYCAPEVRIPPIQVAYLVHQFLYLHLSFEA